MAKKKAKGDCVGAKCQKRCVKPKRPNLERLWLVIVECESETMQQEMENRLREQGIACSLRML